jgi:L(+)-tartrate dehydratase alpha subunit
VEDPLRENLRGVSPADSIHFYCGYSSKMEVRTMTNENSVKRMTDIISQFVGFTAKKLPDDVIEKLQELRDKEDSPMAKVIYDTMFRNQDLAVELGRPSCQDTGVLQFWVKCGTKFPLIDEVEGLLKEAVIKSTVETPLRHNSVETFDEYNTGKNVGKGTPTVWWDIVPHSDQCEIYTYMAGGGCTLPGNATVLMPGEGYEGVTKFSVSLLPLRQQPLTPRKLLCARSAHITKMPMPQRWKSFLKTASTQSA